MAALPKSPSKERGTKGSQGLTGTAHKIRESVKKGISQSRYLNDFQEEKVLGRGGYGVVVQVVGRVDGMEYAVKKMAVQENEKKAAQREVLPHHLLCFTDVVDT